MILPHDAISSFNGDHYFLSNFSPYPVVIDSVEYPTAEHAYQSYKTVVPSEREAVRTARSPAVAKHLGKTVTLIPDWNNKRIEVMRMVLEKKFENPELRQKLIDTFPCMLVEGNWWGDKFWGICNGRGYNHLGKLLMELRERLVQNA